MANEFKVVKQLIFPGDESPYVINAHALEGSRLSDIMDEITRVEEKIDTVSSFDALRYMGTLAAGATLPKASKGDVYKVTSKGTIAGAKVEVGDMLICNTDDTAENTVANWDIIQGNVDVESILAHTHTGTVSLTKTAKTLTHTPTLSKANISGSFTGGSASVKGDHGHTASGSVTLTPGGTVGDKSITPKGTVKITSPTTAGTNDFTYTPAGSVEASDKKFVTNVTVSNHEAHTHTGTTNSSDANSVTGTVTIKTGTGTANYTPAGTLNNATTVTSVEPGTNNISAHTVSSVSSAGGHTPAGSVTVDNATAGGTVAEHKHNVQISAPTANAFNTAVYSGSGMDGVLTFGTAAFVTSATVSKEDSVAPAFTGAAHSHTASFKGTAVDAHTHTVTIDDHDAIVPNINVTSDTHKHTFTGTGVQLVAEHSLQGAAHTHTFTTAANTTGMEHTVTAPTESHTHEFAGTADIFHADFTGTAESHNHSFTGAGATHEVSVTVNDFTGNLAGTASGTVGIDVTAAENGQVVTGVSINNHTLDTVDSATVTTGTGKQD